MKQNHGTKLVLHLIAIWLLTCSVTTNAATQIVVGDQLVGAEGILVDGISYNVMFLDRTCPELFDGCDQVSDFTFQSQTAALAASQALLDQVLLDSASGSFDSNPTDTMGCTGPGTIHCYLITPYSGDDDTDRMDVAFAYNNVIESSDGVAIVSGVGRSFNSTGSTVDVWAVWSLAPVPVPAAIWLFGSALLGVAGLKRR